MTCEVLRLANVSQDSLLNDKDMIMTVSGMIQKLNVQMNRGFYTSNLYLQLSLWCTERSLTGTATFLRNQAQNNVTQMMRVFNYMKLAGGNPVVNAVDAPISECDCLESLFSQALADHQKHCDMLAQLTEEAKALKDYSTLSFLKSVIIEQQQDGVLLSVIFDKVRSARKAGICNSQTDRHLTTLINHQLH